MRLCFCVIILEKYTFVCGIPLKNRELCAIFSGIQFLVAFTSLLQCPAVNAVQQLCPAPFDPLLDTTLIFKNEFNGHYCTFELCMLGIPINHGCLDDRHNHHFFDLIHNLQQIDDGEIKHVYSMKKHGHVFACHSNITDASTIGERYLAYDIIIFDYGLMHRILGTNECVANYLDGGFMRSLWCLSHTSSLFLLMVALYCITKPIWLLWPALLVQSSYALGLAVLTMATAPKMLEALGGKVDADFGAPFAIYIFGFIINWLFTFVFWHYYWYIEQKQLLLKRSVVRR